MIDGFDLTGRTALVTGSSRGIGRAIAVGLGRCGARVAVHYAGRVDAARQVLDELGGQGCTVRGDLADGDAPREIIDAVNRQLGRIDILVLNASVQHRRRWDQPDRDAFDEQVVVNLRSAFEMIQLAGPAMCDRGWGRIVTVGSVQQHRPSPAMLPYGALKSALEQLARNLAKQLAPHGVTVNHLSPGVIETDRNAEALADPDRRERVRAKVPLGRFGTPEDCVGATLLLCSGAGAYITGIDLPVDGGLRLP